MSTAILLRYASRPLARFGSPRWCTTSSGAPAAIAPPRLRDLAAQHLSLLRGPSDFGGNELLLDLLQEGWGSGKGEGGKLRFRYGYTAKVVRARIGPSHTCVHSGATVQPYDDVDSNFANPLQQLYTMVLRARPRPSFAGTTLVNAFEGRSLLDDGGCLYGH